jgi:hypothetical protein
VSVALTLLKHWKWLAIGLLVAALAYTNHNLSNARKALQSEDDWRTVLQLRTGAKANDHTTLYATIDAALTESANRAQALVTISEKAKTAHEQSVAADAALKKAQAENAKRFAAAQRTIAELQARTSTGNRDEDWKILEQDTQAPWKDWK